MNTTLRDTPAPWMMWGGNLDENTVEQMRRVVELPVAVRGALMPDAHLGYGLPIGGVLACDNAVIPYAVGMDIACRMRLTVLDLSAEMIEADPARLKRAIRQETRFGVGAKFAQGRRRSHPVLDDAAWHCGPVTKANYQRACEQLGTSGSGNHFVEFGLLTLDRAELGLRPGRYLSLLSHGGSRGVGGAVATYYSRLAADRRPELPKSHSALAWFEMDSPAGREYFAAMELMGRYSAANHELIHRHVLENLGSKALATVENHHNFAWREQVDGRECIVHRKGATPAAAGVLGVIPGSMASPGFVVRGRGNAESLSSASHGAGRVMSRKRARKTLTWRQTKAFLADRGVQLMQAGLDEAPMVYKDIETVMAAQADLVEIVARFDPKIVMMAGGGERPED